MKINNLDPIPVNDKLTIEWSNPRAGRAQIRLFDFTGKVVRQRSLTTAVGAQYLQLNVADLVAGVYFVTIELDGEVVSRRVSVR